MIKPVVEVDFTIVGAGIVGLCLAKELRLKYPSLEIAVIDQENYLGEHSSGRNSGVLHAGIYYSQNSLKHTLCIEGNFLWQELASELQIPINKCGKYIFSTSKGEEESLYELLTRAQKNNVPSIRMATKSELLIIQELAKAQNAIVSPFSGIIDVSESLARLKEWLIQKGVNVSLKTQVINLNNEQSFFTVETADFIIKSPALFNCAGVGAVSLREKLGLKDVYLKLVKGNYLATTQQLNYSSLFYPIPPKDLKGLGVHSTIDITGKVKFGPNTEDTNHIDYSPSPIALEEMKPTISKLFKNIEHDKLYWDYAGCRTKIYLRVNQQIYSDFWIKNPIPHYWECLGIESPGLTSAPAISKYIVSRL